MIAPSFVLITGLTASIAYSLPNRNDLRPRAVSAQGHAALRRGPRRMGLLKRYGVSVLANRNPRLMILWAGGKLPR
jgi:hypothetical protein